MKNIFTLLLLLTAGQLLAQTNPITAINITLPANPDANTANWGTGANIFTITAVAQLAQGRVNPILEESKILVAIKKDGTKICGAYTGNSAPAANFNSASKVWSGANAVSLLGKDCTLPPGDYELCVQFFGNGAVGATTLSEEKCKPFSIPGGAGLAYQPPQLILPADGTRMTETDIKKPIIFRWLPVTPKPVEPITYRLNIYQKLTGQNGPQAIKANQPIITKDVDNITQSIITNLITGPCKPPYLCDFVWNVQALNKDGKPIGGNNGTSGNNEFKMLSSSVKIDNYAVTCVSYGVYSFTLTAENTGNAPFYTNAIGFTSTGGSVSGATISPAVPGTNISSGTPVTFTGTFNYNGTYPAAVVAAINGHEVGNTQLTSGDTEQDSLKACICKDCDNTSINFTSFSASPNAGSGNRYNIAGNISVSGLAAIYGIEVQVETYNYTADPPACSNGVTGIEQSGMFMRPGTSINNISAIQMFNETISGSANTNNNAPKTIKLVSTTPMPASIPVNLLVGLPGPLAGLNSDCCKITYNLCIKVKVFYDRDACKSCSYTYCFPSFTNH